MAGGALVGLEITSMLFCPLILEGIMSTVMRDNWINVGPDDPRFSVLTNLCDYFRLGNEDGDDIWLEGQVLDGEFIFNGRLYLKDGSYGTLIDSFPKGSTLEGWSQRRRLDVEGFELVDPAGEVIFSFRVDGLICSVDVSLYKKDGTLAAHGGQGGLVSHVPTMLGRGGIVIT